MPIRDLKVILAKPRGFCAGVERAIEIVERAIKKYGPPIYVRHEIVHNKFVVQDLKNKGAIFVDEINDIPEGGITIFSAHGVSSFVEDEAYSRSLSVIDATCPLVKKVHKEAIKHDYNNREIILIGHAGHPEVEGTSGRVKSKVQLIQSLNDAENIQVSNPNMLSYVTQTTLSVDDTKRIISKLKERFPLIEGPDLKDICYATQNRQDAVKELAKEVDIILVIGSKNSSNSNRLRDLGEEVGRPSYLINDKNDIDCNWFENKHCVGITAGASAPEILLENILNHLSLHFNISISTQDGVLESVRFKLPLQLENVI